MKKYPYLNNKTFLAEVDKQQFREHYVKITVLDWEENEVASVQSSITTGNISINGDSTLRRSGSLTAVLDSSQYNINDISNLFSINKKIIIEKGLANPFVNTTYKNYPILWFPYGLFIITGVSVTIQTNNNIQLSLTVQDKMCLLNGTIGGKLPAAMVLDRMETIDKDGNKVDRPVIIKQIITELVNHWGKEQLGNIIVSDIPEKILAVRKWNQVQPLIIHRATEDASAYIDIEVEFHTLVAEDQVAAATELEQGIDPGIEKYDWKLTEEAQNYYDIFFKTDVIGYCWSDFIYTGSKEGLIAQPGDTITSVLDKLVSYLDNTEYFYDVYGNFIFRQKTNNLNITESNDLSNLINNYDFSIGSLDISLNENNNIAYSFNDDVILTAISMNPNIQNIKNDFIVWGQKTESKLPICYQVCIDDMPTIPANITYEVFYYTDNDTGLRKAGIPHKYSSQEEMESIAYPVEGEFYTPGDGKIYTYDPDTKTFALVESATELKTISTSSMKEWQTYVYYRDLAFAHDGQETSYYYTRLINEWPKVFDLEANTFKDSFLKDNSNSDFYLELISGAAVSKYNIKNIGRRTYVYKSDKINCLFEPADIPDYVFINVDDYYNKNNIVANDNYQQAINNIKAQNSNYAIFDVNTKWLQQTIQEGWRSAYAAIRDLLYQYTNYNETVQLTSLPIYYMDANCQVILKLDKYNIKGTYWVKSVSIPFDSNGTMNITTTKLLQKF